MLSLPYIHFKHIDLPTDMIVHSNDDFNLSFLFVCFCLDFTQKIYQQYKNNYEYQLCNTIHYVNECCFVGAFIHESF